MYRYSCTEVEVWVVSILGFMKACVYQVWGLPGIYLNWRLLYIFRDMFRNVRWIYKCAVLTRVKLRMFSFTKKKEKKNIKRGKVWCARNATLDTTLFRSWLETGYLLYVLFSLPAVNLPFAYVVYLASRRLLAVAHFEDTTSCSGQSHRPRRHGLLSCCEFSASWRQQRSGCHSLSCYCMHKNRLTN